MIRGNWINDRMKGERGEYAKQLSFKFETDCEFCSPGMASVPGGAKVPRNTSLINPAHLIG